MDKHPMMDPKTTKSWIKRHPVITGIVVFIIFLFVIAGSGDGKKTEQTVATNVPAQSLTPEDRLKAIVKDIPLAHASYVGMDIEKSDPDRPVDTKMITVKYSLSSFYNKDSLYRNTGELSAKTFQEIYSSHPEAYDVLVWYYGDTTDKYGNAENKVILVYTIDKATYEKIAWSNFDSGNLCEFLKNESDGYDTACNTLVQID